MDAPDVRLMAAERMERAERFTPPSALFTQEMVDRATEPVPAPPSEHDRAYRFAAYATGLLLVVAMALAAIALIVGITGQLVWDGGAGRRAPDTITPPTHGYKLPEVSE